MSELITQQSAQGGIRWQLLATVSALAITGASCAVPALAGDADKPTVWIELGAQLDRVQGGEDPFLPSFLSANAPRPFETTPSSEIQRPPRYALGGEGKITFAPAGSDWSLTAAVRYGRSNSSKHVHQQTSVYRQSGIALLNDTPVFVRLTNFTDTASAHKSSYLISDFMAGRDVGLGLWGGKSSTVVDFGVRFAQFTAKSTTTQRELPDSFNERIPQPPSPFFPSMHKYKTYSHHHSYYGHNAVSRSFSGVGPTISLNGSQAIAGNVDEDGLSFDWGVNAAVLFGRQSVRGSHKTSSIYFQNFALYPASVNRPPAKDIARSRSVVVPNVGGFAGISVRYSDAKLSLGYRGDFFFGAMDGGIDARDARNRSFHGPFATVSIGFGG